MQTRIEQIVEDQKDVSGLWAYRRNPEMSRYRLRNNFNQELMALLSQKADLVVTINKIDRLLEKTRIFRPESQNLEGSILDNVEVKHENIIDVGGMDTTMVSVGATKVPDIGQNEVLSITRFLSRPVEIDTFETKVGNRIEAEYPLWDILSSDPTVRSKLRNFAYFKANIKVRIAISGTPFHMGKVLVSYQPYPLRNSALQASLANYANSTLGGYYPLLISYLSQAAGTVVLDVRMNKPTEITIPFISTKAMHRLFNVQTTAISGATALADFENAGSLFVYSINAVDAVTTDPTPIAVQIYAWFEDVQLGTTTATQLEVVTESDERKVGVLERFATSAATYTGYLTAIPQIAPLAKASSIALKGIAGVAAWFGWSRPAILEKPVFMKGRPFSNSCVTIGDETVEKMTWDPLQELTIDPRVVGIEVDELSFKHLCSIESYLTTFAWAPDDAPMADPIFACAVTPSLGCITNETTVHFVQPVPMAMVAAAMRYWRGSIEFRFEVVCSNFHRGKLAVFYEPNVNHFALINADVATNKQFLNIVDIQETQSFSVCVNWAQPRAWNMTSPLSDYIGLQAFGTTTFTATNLNGFINGYIGVVPFTDLQSPVDSGIYVNVYVRGKDLQFNVLSEANLPTDRRLIPESADLTHSILDNSVTCIELNDSTSTPTETSDYHFGEQPLSFRSALKRYVLTGQDDQKAGVGYISQVWEGLNMVLPTPTFGVPPTILQRSLLTYLPYAFLGCRGGVRKRITFVGAGSHQIVNAAVATMGNPVASLITPNIDDSAVPATARQRGSVIFIPSTNAGLEFELPYYSNNLFHFCCADDLIGPNGTDDMFTSWIKSYTLMIDCVGVADDVVWAVEHTAAAEDFTFMRFLGVPYFSLGTP